MPGRLKLQLYLIVVIILFAGQDARAENHFSIGVEGFRDAYHEYGEIADPNTGDDIGASHVDTHTDYGSITAGYLHEYNHFFSAIDGRYSSGSADYKSRSGVFDGLPEIETDVRLRTGVDLTTWHGHVMPYVGLGWRYYFQNGKGRSTVTDFGSGPVNVDFYDRRINQFYAPIGATYQFTSGSWTFSPNAELDFLLFGRVNSQLGEVPGDSNIINNQHSGFGFRSEFMAGQQYQSFSWEIGPFIRYWRIQESDLSNKITTPGGVVGNVEPENTRMQYGLAFRLKY